MVMIHGDDNGLVLPPKVAPVQAVVIPKTPPKVVLKKLSEAWADVNAALEAATIRSEGGLKRLSEAADSLLRSSEAAGIISEIEIKRLSKAFAAATAKATHIRSERPEVKRESEAFAAATAKSPHICSVRPEVERESEACAAATAKAPHIRSERPEVKRESEACAAAASALEAAGIRTEVDQLGDIPLSCKIAHWMGKGVPLIVLVNDPDSDSVRIVRRTDGKKKVVPKIDLASEARLLLDVMQDEMLRFAKKKRDACVKMAHTWEDFELGLTSKKLLLAPWCDEAGVGKEIEDRTNGVAKIFCTPFTQPELPPGTRCFATGKLARVWSYWSR